MADGILYEYDIASEDGVGSIIAIVDLDETDVLQNITTVYSDYLSTEKLGFDSVEGNRSGW